jgi:hypothetical protein
VGVASIEDITVHVYVLEYHGTSTNGTWYVYLTIWYYQSYIDGGGTMLAWYIDGGKVFE